MKKKLLILVLLTQTVFAYPPLPEARSEPEALFVRRIIDFWRDKEYPLAKSEICAYMNNYPKGPFTDHFYAMLGDMAMHEKAYPEALEFYNGISDAKLSSHVQTKRWQALYQMQLYTQLYQELASIQLDEKDEEGKFYFAEAAFREALTLLCFPEGKEQAKLLCEEALPLYASLSSSTDFGAHAKLAMAEIYRFLERPEKAAHLYLEIAEDQENQEEVLFHAAAMLMQCDQEKGAALFETIARGESLRAGEAAYQWLLFLAIEGKWDIIENARTLWLKKISKEQSMTVYFYLGMIAFDQGRHYQAIADLQKALDRGIASPHDRSALEALLTSAKEVGNLDVCESSFFLLTKRYPERRGEAGYVRAVAYKRGGLTERALALFEDLIQQFPSHVVAEKACVEKVQILTTEKRWEEAHAGVLTFLRLYPRSDQRGKMLRLAIDLSQIQASENALYAQLADDLERAFAARIFQGEERVEKEVLLVKSYLKLDRIHAALGLLHEMDDPDPLLFAQCYVKEGASHEKVIVFGEKALEKYPEHDRLHLHLFNAYLELAKGSCGEALTKRAANHLDAVIDLYPISLENRLWLTHYFIKTQSDRAIYLLESLLQTETNWKRFDEEGLILARLYQKKGFLNKAVSLLEKFIALGQRTKPEAELISAEIYYELGEREKAEALFAGLEDSSHLPIAHAASLYLARLRFDRQPKESLKKLHDLKVRKNLVSEPIHLEAALDHAELQASLLPAEERLESILTTLIGVKEEFTSNSTICSKDYHESRRLMPEKEQIYQAYMRYLDARIYYLQAKTASDPREKKMKESAARALFSTLCRGEYAVSKYLVEHAAVGMYDE